MPPSTCMAAAWHTKIRGERLGPTPLHTPTLSLHGITSHCFMSFAGTSDEDAQQRNALTAASLGLHTLSVAVQWLAGLPQRCRSAYPFCVRACVCNVCGGQQPGKRHLHL